MFCRLKRPLMEIQLTPVMFLTRRKSVLIRSVCVRTRKCLLLQAYCSIAHRKWAGWVVGWVLGGKKGSSGGARNVFNKTTWCGTNRTHFWQATSMVVIEWIVKDYFASKGKAGAQAMFVLDIFLRQGAYSCAGMLLQAFAQELDAFYVGSPGCNYRGTNNI